MEGSEVLALKWNNHQSIFYHIICGLRSKETYTDATLACEGKFFPVHKLVLSTCSEYFSDIFERTPCKNPVVVLKDIKCTDLCFLLDYMYIGEVNVRQNELSSLIKAAECLRVKGLAVPDEETPQKGSSKNLSSRQQQQQQQQPGRQSPSPSIKRRRTEDRRSFVSDSSPEQPPFKRSSGGSSHVNYNSETKSSVALRREEVNISEQRISQIKDVSNQSEKLTPVIKLEQDDSYETLPNHQDLYEDPQYMVTSDQSCGDISSKGSRADGERVEFIKDDLDHNFSDILNEETLLTDFTHPPGGHLEPWDGAGHDLSSHTEMPIDTSNLSHNPRQQQKDPSEGSGINSELMCPICGRCSSRRDNLDRHIRSHLGDKPFMCPFCPFRAQLKYNMKTHVERRHPEQMMLNPNITFEQGTETN